MISDFLKDELGIQPFSLPVALEQKYSELIRKFQCEVQNFGTRTYALSDLSKESVAWQFDRYFPSHYFKSYYSLLQMESNSVQEHEELSLLSWPSVTVMDIGCGSGAASLAALTIIQKYQLYKVTHSAPISPVNVQLIGVDPNSHMLQLYDKLCLDFANSLEPELIRVSVCPFEGEFPQDIRRVLRQYSSSNQHSVLMVLSNVIRILEELYRSGETGAIERIMRLLTGRKYPSGAFGAAEALAIESIIEEWEIDNVSILGVATTGAGLNPHQWRDGLENLFRGIKANINPHYLDAAKVERNAISFYNPQASYWRRECNYERYNRLPFHYAYSRVFSQNYQNNNLWREILDLDNLVLAWARTRRYTLIDEVLPDECEAKLFDHYLHERLIRFRNHMLMKKWEALNIQRFLYFHVPKKLQQTRPKVTARFEEQIISTAIVQHLGATIRQDRNFSHRLNPDRIEYLYEHWWHLYRQFLTETRKLAAQSKTILRADITRFYQNIDQKILLDIIKKELQVEGIVGQVLKLLIEREFPADHHKGEGLPQGHIASGFWANLYLNQVDEAFSGLDGVKYARYADDMVFAINPDRTPTDSVEYQLKKLLKVLQLEASKDKTFPQSSEEYRKQAELDQEVDKVAREVSRLRVKLFYLDKDYMNRYSTDPWKFAEIYQRLLNSLGIYVSQSWLCRKIDQKNNKWGLPIGFQRLKFPSFPSNEEETEQWGSAFEDLNLDWILQLNKIRNQLAEFFTIARVILSSGQAIDDFVVELHTTRFRFAVNRLCGLDLTPIAEQVAEEVIDRPWLVNVNWVCRGLSSCGHYKLLLKILRESKVAFVRAQALRSLGQHTEVPEIRKCLWSVLLKEGSTACEKLKASEGLISSNNWDDADLDSCISLIEHEQNPYLQKNYILVLGQAFGEESRSYIKELQSKEPSPIITDTIQYLLSSNFVPLLSSPEPDILSEYYDEYYPDDESDDKSDESDPSWVPF